MDTPQTLVTVLGAGGGGAALLALINGIIKWLSGSSGRERQKNTDLISQRRHAVEDRDKALRQRDKEADRRRNALDKVSVLRRQLIEAGIAPKVDLDDEEQGDETDG